MHADSYYKHYFIHLESEQQPTQVQHKLECYLLCVVSSLFARKKKYTGIQWCKPVKGTGCAILNIVKQIVIVLSHNLRRNSR